MDMGRAKQVFGRIRNMVGKKVYFKVGRFFVAESTILAAKNDVVYFDNILLYSNPPHIPDLETVMQSVESIKNVRRIGGRLRKMNGNLSTFRMGHLMSGDACNEISRAGMTGKVVRSHNVREWEKAKLSFSSKSG